MSGKFVITFVAAGLYFIARPWLVRTTGLPL